MSDVSPHFQVRGQHLRMIRDNLGWSLNRLAAEVEIDTSHLSRVENGERDLSKAVAQRIAAVLRVDVAVFWKPTEESVG